MFRAPRATINVPIILTTATKAPAPVAAAAIDPGPPAPIRASAPVMPVMVKRRIDNDEAVSMLGSALRADKAPIITARAATTPVRTPKVATALVETILTFPSIIIDALIVMRRIPMLAAEEMADSGANPATAAIIPAKTTTTAIKATIPELIFPTLDVAASIIAKAPIKEIMHNVAFSTFAGSRPDKRATAPARIAIVTDNAIAVLEASFEYPLAPTISANMRRSLLTASVALSNPEGSRVESNDIAKDITRIAPDIRRREAPALTAFFPARLVAAMISVNITKSLDIALRPWSIVPVSMLPSISIDLLISMRAAEIAKIPIPAFAAFPPANDVAAIRPVRSPNIIMMFGKPATIADVSRLANSNNTAMTPWMPTTTAMRPSPPFSPPPNFDIIAVRARTEPSTVIIPRMAFCIPEESTVESFTNASATILTAAAIAKI